ncbi:ABC transporter ATP-binding protein [Treponema pedis]|uniref:ABC transporter ATP-binding protein n=1 Tax=Treponema pedis TaxID=409322 RepID=A0A7S7AXP1_9SPIR|nr:ABC transporter ATP-binding protein [Treponema pedis]QOW61806.1 ABC transporter ATP-binding protein [Treponema pedis]
MKQNRLHTFLNLIRYLKRIRKYMVLNCVICCIYEVLPIINVFLVSFVVGNIFRGAETNYPLIFMLLIFFTVLHSIFGYLNMWTEHDIAYRLLYEMRYEMYCRLEKALPSFSNPMMSSEITSIASNDMNLIEWFYAHTANIYVACILMFLSLEIFFFYIHYWIAVNSFLWIVLYLLCPFLFNRKSQEDGKNIRETYGKLSNAVIDGIQGLREIMSFNLLKQYKTNLFRAVRTYDETKRKDAQRRSHEWVYVMSVMALMNITMLLIANKLYRSESLDVKWIPVILAMSGSLFVVFSKFISMSTQFSSVFAAASRVFHLLNLPIQVEDCGKEKFDGKIETVQFENVVYSYPGSSDNQIKKMNFTLDKNKKIALSGESGAGKSTIVHLLQRYADPIEGRILVNGRDIREFTLDSWRSAIAVVTQETYLFKGTVAENIRMGNPEATMGEVISAAKIAQAHDFIMEMPSGYDSEVGERALKLSGGQKQRISIARAILKGCSFIIFDEAQSALDSENEEKLNLAIKNSFHNKLLLFIAHRVSSVRSSDRVLFIDDGKVISFDTFDELKKNNSLFREKVLGGKK